MNYPSEALLKVELRLVARAARPLPRVVRDDGGLTLAPSGELDQGDWEASLRSWLSPLDLKGLQVELSRGQLRLKGRAIICIVD